MKRANLYLYFLILYTSLFAAQTPGEIHKESYTYQSQKQYAKVIELNKKLLASDVRLTDDEASESYYLIGYAYRKQNLFAESIEYFERAIDATKNPDKRGKIYNNIVGVLHYMNLNRQAIIEADKAIKLSPLWAPVSYYNKSLAYEAISDYANAAKALEDGLQACVKNGNQYYKAKLYNQYGVIEMGMFEQTGRDQHAKLARQYYGYAMEIRDNKVEVGKAIHQLAKLELLSGDTLQSQRQFLEAIKYQKYDQYRFYVMHDYSLLMMNLGRMEEVRTIVDSALAIFPSITLSGKTLKIFFTAQNLDIEVPQFEGYFDEYVEQRERTEKAYAAYIGRQILKQRQIMERNLWIKVFSTAIILFLAIVIIWKIRENKVNLKTVQDAVKFLKG